MSSGKNNRNDKEARQNILQPPRGTRDFYPEAMAVRTWLTDCWRNISLKHGFVEYDAPIFENLDLYRIKSGDEIVSQLFSFEDRGGRSLALRPEITPTLARMVASKAASLPRPIKWFSIPRLCRAERPQRGRLREFFQWNIDVIGSDDVLADAECMFVAVDMLRSIGLGPDEIELRVNSRTVMSALLEQEGVEAARHEQAFAIMDKYDKLDQKEFRTYAIDQGLTGDQIDRMLEILSLKSLSDVEGLARTDQARAEFDRLHELHRYLDGFGVGEYFKYQPSIVRGLAYYTGIVYEIFDRASKLRAIAGGGRYDHLIELFGGPSMPAAGFGMGDVVLMEFLADIKKLPDLTALGRLDVFIIDADREQFSRAIELVGALRAQGLSVDVSYRRQNVSKQLKQANNRGAMWVAILGQETAEDGSLTLKHLASGNQRQVSFDEFKNRPTELLAQSDM